MRNRNMLYAGAALLWLACIAANAAAPDVPAPQLLAWLASMAVLLAATRAGLPNRPWRPRMGAWLRTWRLDLGLGLGLFLVALALRAYALADVPINVHGDEGEMGLAARAVLAGRLANPFTTGWLSHPTLWFFIQAGSLAIFGDTIFGLRMLSALMGAASVACWFALARHLYGRVSGLAGALILAAYHFHLQMSRVGVNNIADLPFTALAVLAYYQGVARRSPTLFAAAGLALGLSQHMYMGARLAPLILAFIIVMDVARKRLVPRRDAPFLAPFGGGFVLAMGPLLAAYLANPAAVFTRVDMIGYFGSLPYSLAVAQNGLGPAVVGQLAAAFGALYGVADKGPWYAPGMGLLDGLSFALFLVGLAIAAQHIRDSGHAFLLATVAGTCLLGGFLLIETPNLQRYTPLAPALCQLVAFGATAPSTLVSASSARARAGLHALSAVLTLAVVGWSLSFYFGNYAPRSAIGFQNVEVATKLANELNAQSDSGREPFVFLAGAPRLYFEYGTLRFVAPNARGVNLLSPLDVQSALPATPDVAAADRVWFVFTRDRRDEVALAQARFPGGVLRSVDDYAGAPLYWVYALHGADLGPAQH